MDLLTIIIFAVAIVILIILGIVAYVMWDKSFRNSAHVARQTGKDINDVIWIKTRFKVINNSGQWHIVFRHIKERTGSIEGKFWTKFVIPNKVVKISKEDWDKRDMSKLIRRGLYLYETSEGVFFPMTINAGKDMAEFKIIDQDNRMFLINELANINSLTRDRRKEMIGMIALIIGIVVLGAVGFGGFYFIHQQSLDGLSHNAMVCAEYAKAVFNVTSGNSNQYIGNIPGLPGG